MKARGNNLKKPNWLRCCVFEVTDSFEIAGSLGTSYLTMADTVLVTLERGLLVVKRLLLIFLKI